jgi:hypothetical protein
MTAPVCRLFLGLVLSGALLLAGLGSGGAAAQSSCDPAYPDFCLAPVWEGGYLDCATLGISDFTVYPPDPQGYDPDFNGIGCESYAAGSAPAGDPSAAMPVAGSECDPSYPEVCLPSAPDLNCVDVGFALTVIYDPSIGAYDPHLLDEDYDGIGCESW